MNHFNNTIEKSSEHEKFHLKKNTISYSIKKFDSNNCASNYKFSNLNTIANIGLAIGISIAPSNCKSIKSEYNYSETVILKNKHQCHRTLFDFEKINNSFINPKEEEQLAIAVTYSPDLKRMPPKKTYTVKTTLIKRGKGIPSRI